MQDAEPQALRSATPASSAFIVQRIRLAVVGIFILGLLVQFYLAGRGAFGASSYSAHRDLGDILHFVPPVILLLTLASRVTRNRVDIIHSILLIVLFEVQFALADLKHPDAGAFHPLNGLLLLGVSYSLLRRDVRTVVASRREQPLTS
jgi:glycopeptide antibiotics resistance protein